MDEEIHIDVENNELCQTAGEYGKVFVERRSSSRHNGKKRPFYGSPKKDIPVPEKKRVSPKNSKLKKIVKACLPASEENGASTDAALSGSLVNESGQEEARSGAVDGEVPAAKKVGKKTTTKSKKTDVVKLKREKIMKNLREEASEENGNTSGAVAGGNLVNQSREGGSNDGGDGATEVMVDLSPPIDLGGKTAQTRVKETIRLFNKHYLTFIQEEELRCKKADEANKDGKRSSQRPDLKAITKMKGDNTILYDRKRFGHLAGVDVGFRFYSRAEMVVVGNHAHWLNGIDYMGNSYRNFKEYTGYNFPIAVSIVMSGMYQDDDDNFDVVTYTGQGGNDLLGNKEQIKDQLLVRGNLALKNSMEQSVPVRVTRGHDCASSYCGKVYTYDGLYKVTSWFAETGTAGFKVYKYKLRRLSGQPALTTTQVHFIRAQGPKSIADVPGLVCDDISGGQENIPVPATNTVDDPPVRPTGYSYCKSIQLAEDVVLPSNCNGCKCKGNCTDPRVCECAKLNGSDFPYVQKDGGRLVEAKAVVFECGPKCGCGPGCVNRTSQRGLRYRLEVFRTPSKGWAVRSWDFIPSGAPVCEYVGKLMKTEDMDIISENDYIFEIDCLQTMKGLDGRASRPGVESLPEGIHLDKGDDKTAPEYCIDAGPVGSVARFINHSCEPNLFVQCVLSSHRDIKLARVMLFAADNISPMQELCYDYGYVLDSVTGADGKIKVLQCRCGAVGCRERLY